MTGPPLVHSKGEVDRAGQLWVEFLPAYRARGEAAVDEFGADEIIESDKIIAWWRARHARPLRMLNANLRYYLNP